jgi:hypothetical protein
MVLNFFKMHMKNSRVQLTDAASNFGLFAVAAKTNTEESK